MRRTLFVVVVSGLLVLPAVALAAEFPEVTEAERSLSSAPGYPEAPAVVLFNNGHFTMMGALGNEAYSSLEVEGRLKLLKKEGADYGEVKVAHSDFVRLISFEGRTVLPDGRTVPLPDDALFETTVSGQKRWSVTTATFPALEPGAIIDYRFELRFESYNSFDPWYFQQAIPTLHSEITYTVPRNVSAVPWGKATFGRHFQSEKQRAARGQQLRVWMDDLPPIPDEPLTFPYEDLSSSFMLLPTLMKVSGQVVLLFKDWSSACDLVDYSYADARRRDGEARRTAKRMAKEVGKDDAARARTILAFVRDEIDTLDIPGVFPLLGQDIDEMLRNHRADVAGKGLILREMLDGAGIDGDLVWAAERSSGTIDTSVANPNWFERVLVRVTLDGQTVYLDPVDPAAAPGYLAPDLEGMPAVIFSRRKPEVIELPSAPFEDNLRRATLDLAVDEDGRLTGTGSMVLAGHHAARWLRAESGPEGLTAALSDDLDDRFPGFDVTEVEVTADREGPRIELSWTLAQRDEEVLGDQVTVAPSRPLGPIQQRFTLTPSQRLTPVLLAFADRDEVDLTVRWPEGWTAEVVPEPVAFDNAAGAFQVESELDEPERTLHLHRRFDTSEKSFVGPAAYGALRDLYARAEAGDNGDLVLARP